MCLERLDNAGDTTLIPHSGVVLSLIVEIRARGTQDGKPVSRASTAENAQMATREKRLAQFDGSGEPTPDQPVEVLCEDHSGTYQLPFTCRFIDGQWRNEKTGGAVEAAVIGWRMPRIKQLKPA
jgi:hypothetical protein